MRHLDLFVDREKQYDAFQQMLKREMEWVVMLVKAPTEMGKTWLIQKMHAFCQECDIPTVHVNFRDPLPYNYLELIDSARWQIGREHFDKLAETLEQYAAQTADVRVALPTSEGSGSVSVSDVTNSRVSIGGDVVGRDKITVGQLVVTGDERRQQAAELKINEAFFENLADVLAEHQTLVFLFDSYEDVTEEAKQWLLTRLLLHLRYGRLDGTIVIIAGQTIPDPPESIETLTVRTRLDVFKKDDEKGKDYVRECLKRRGLTDADLERLAQEIEASRGYPGLLAKIAERETTGGDEDDQVWL